MLPCRGEDLQVSEGDACVGVLVRDLEVHAADIPDADAFGCFTIKMRIIKMCMLQMSAFKVHVATIIKTAGVEEARARARHSVRHPTEVTSLNAHSSPDKVGMTFTPVLQRRKLRHRILKALNREQQGKPEFQPKWGLQKPRLVAIPGSGGGVRTWNTYVPDVEKSRGVFRVFVCVSRALHRRTLSFLPASVMRWESAAPTLEFQSPALSPPKDPSGRKPEAWGLCSQAEESRGGLGTIPLFKNACGGALGQLACSPPGSESGGSGDVPVWAGRPR